MKIVIDEEELFEITGELSGKLKTKEERDALMEYHKMLLAYRINEQEQIEKAESFWQGLGQI